MSQFHFGVRVAHTYAGRIPSRVVQKIDKIAQKHGCDFVQIQEPTHIWKAWFSGPNRGEPFDRALAQEVMEAVRAAGHGSYFDDGGSP